MHSKQVLMTALYLIGAFALHAQDRPLEVSPAQIGAVYAYALRTNETAEFERLERNANWLDVTPDGILTGTPDPDAPAISQITVCARRRGEVSLPQCKAGLKKTFVVLVQGNGCRSAGALSWCGDPARRPLDEKRFTFTLQDSGKVDRDTDCEGCIVQFDRLHPAGGRLGNYNNGLYRRIAWDDKSLEWSSNLSKPDITVINAINGSKVFLSGSVLIHKDVENCSFWSWSVITQTGNSSNNLYYGPSDLTSFCAGEKNGKASTVLIVLPAHALWANVYGVRANTNDPAWKPASDPPQSHECWTGERITPSPTQGIQPCDAQKASQSGDAKNNDQASNWFLRDFLYSSFGEWTYNRLAQPGVSQGSISIAPIAAATKSTWDVQTYGSTLLGLGWIGLQGTYEHDRNLKDDLNSFTAALTYEMRGAWRGKPRDNILPSSWSRWNLRDNRKGPDRNAGPPVVAVRPIELSGRAGPEWSPDAFKYKSNSVTSPTQPTQYLPRDLNFVFAAGLRLPIVLSPKLAPSLRQPSALTIAPVAGLERGFRVISHSIGLGTPCLSQAGVLCASQPQEILRRVAGVDASLRSPYNVTHNFLGDKPVTVDYSYRMRELTFAEPFANLQHAAYNLAFPPAVSGQATGGRSYSRITFISPISAYFQFRATWQHGSLPPLFQFVGNQVTIGLTFSNPGSSEH